jgi:hypothetical protein
VLDKVAELLSKIHHKFGVAVDFIDELSEHWNQLFHTSLRSEQLSDLAQPLNGVHLRIRVLAAEVIDEKSNSADSVDFVNITSRVYLIVRHYSNLFD